MTVANPERAERIPLTDAQHELWLGVQLDAAASLAHHHGNVLSLKGPLDVEQLRQALQGLVDRHPALRARFSNDGQWLDIEPALVVTLPVVEVPAEESPEWKVQQQAALLAPFDLAQAPLIRFVLLHAHAESHQLVCVAHMAAVDEWSLALLLMELGAAYSRPGETSTPTLLGLADYAASERGLFASEKSQANTAYWLQKLHTPPSRLPLPHDLPRPRERQYAAAESQLPFSEDLQAALDNIAAAHNATRLETLLAVFAALQHRLSGCEDQIIGVARPGQLQTGFEHLVGHAVNLLPLRLATNRDLPFSALLEQVRIAMQEALEHQDAHFGSIVPQLQFERDHSRPALLPVVFGSSKPSPAPVFDGLQSTSAALPAPATLPELSFTVGTSGVHCIYNKALFSTQAIAARLSEYRTAIAAVCAQPQTAIGNLAILSADALSQLEQLNDTNAEIPAEPVQVLVTAQALRTPDAVAVRFNGQTQSYAALEARARTIAAALAAQGAGPGRFVGVCLERGLDVPAALLAVLKTGAAYLPLDPEFPPERLSYYLEDADAALVLTDAKSSAKLASSHCTQLRLEDIREPADFTDVPVSSTAAAYVIYTSGSTGKPKGVVLPHGALVNFLASMAREPGLQAGDVLAAVTTVSFDIAGLEIWLPLTVGATVLVIDRDTAMDGERLKSTLAQQQVTVMQATPATWRLLLAVQWPGDAARFRAYSGGEPLPRELAEQLLPRVAALWNLYGPTETTIWSTAYRVTDAALPILVGTPIANTQCHVLDAAHNLMPPGITGSLWIGGAGVATGYHNRPQLTAERFVQHPQLGRIYDTGDLARLTPQGLECLGRVDFQVKLRGYRIELGEIEYALSRHAAVAESAVLVRERSSGDARLVAYVVKKPGAETNASELRASVRDFLPAYMVPQDFIMLDALPRLPNGKLDRKALPDPFAAIAARSVREPPQGPAEQALAALWAEILALPNTSSISRDDRFFDLGGHSLLAVRLAGRITETTGTRPGLRTLMMDPLSVIASQLTLTGSAKEQPVEKPAQPGATAAPAEPPRKSGWLGKLFGK